MVSQNQAFTKDQADVEYYRQDRAYRAHSQSGTAAEFSFSGPMRERLKIDQSIAHSDSTAFIQGETQTGKEANVHTVHKQDAGFVISIRNPGLSDVLVYGDVTIIFSEMEVQRNGQPVALTRQEFKTLAYFVKNARRVISRDELLNQVWGYESYPSTRTVDNHILRLRKKLEPEPATPKHFRTVHGMGYRFLP
jgi:hypothetical protein